MKINKQEVENILNMMNSADGDNAYVAFKALEAYDFSGSEFGYLVYLYKFGKLSKEEWSKNAESAYKVLTVYFDLSRPVTYAEGLSTLIENKCEKDLIDMYLKRHVQDLTNTLGGMGYPIDSLNFNITLKSEDE